MIRFLCFVVLVFALMMMGAGVAFIAQFDVNQYKPQLIEEMEKRLGRPVELGPISLGFRGGLLLTFENLEIYSGPKEEAQPVFQVGEVRGVLKLVPLLRKEIQLSSLSLIRPQIQLIRTPEGRIEVLGLTPLPAPPSGPVTRGAQPPVAPVPRIEHPFGRTMELPLEVRHLEIKDGTFVYTDLKQNPQMQLSIRHLDFTLKDLSQTRPIQFKAQMAVLSEEPNLQVQGRLHLPTRRTSGSLSRFRLEADFSKLNLEQLAQVFRIDRAWDLRGEPAGNLWVTIDELSLDAQGWEEMVASIRFSDGRIQFPGMAVPFEEISFEAVAGQGRIDLESFSARLDEGTIQLSGTVEDLADVGQASLQVQVQGVPLQFLLPSVPLDEPQLHGKLSAHLQVQFQGMDALQVFQTISGGGDVTLTEGRLVNLNVLKEVFRHITILPGLTGRLLDRLGPSYREKFETRHTALGPIDFEIQLREGILRFQHLTAATEDFVLTGSGGIRLSDRALQFPASLRVEPNLSAAILRSVEELEVLTDFEGWLEIPVEVWGHLPNLSIRPDLEYLASQFVATKVRDLIGELIQKVLD